MSSVRSPRPVSPTIVGGPPATVNASAGIPPRFFARSKTIRAVSGMPMPCAETVGCRMRTLSSSMYSRSRARTYVSNCVKVVTVGRVSSGRNGRRSGLAFAELAPGRVRGHLDPPLLAEIVDDPVEVLDGFALVHLCARDHVHAVTAVRRKGRSRTARRASRSEREPETRQGQDHKDDDDEEDAETAHIRRGLPPVLTLAGGLPIMTIVRALFLASLLGGLALAACGGAGTGPATGKPALGTNNPAASPMPSSDPYSPPGY